MQVKMATSDDVMNTSRRRHGNNLTCIEIEKRKNTTKLQEKNLNFKF